MKISILDKKHTIQFTSPSSFYFDKKECLQYLHRGSISLSGREIYNLCKEYYSILGREITTLTPENTITEVKPAFQVYNWRPFREYIEMWVHYRDEDGSGGMMFDLPVDIALGEKSHKEGAIIMLESKIADTQEEIVNLKAELAEKKKLIKKYEKQLSKIQNN